MILQNENLKKWVIEIDGIICSQELNCENARPYINRIKFINELYDKGHTIVYFTTRTTEMSEVTKNQFEKWGIKYSQLIFDKPLADYYITNKIFDIGLYDKIFTDTEEYKKLCIE